VRFQRVVVLASTFNTSPLSARAATALARRKNPHFLHCAGLPAGARATTCRSAAIGGHRDSGNGDFRRPSRCACPALLHAHRCSRAVRCTQRDAHPMIWGSSRCFTPPVGLPILNRTLCGQLGAYFELSTMKRGDCACQLPMKWRDPRAETGSAITSSSSSSCNPGSRSPQSCGLKTRHTGAPAGKPLQPWDAPWI